MLMMYDDEQVERYKDDDIISKHSQSSRVVKVKIATGAEQVVLIRWQRKTGKIRNVIISFILHI